MGVVNFDIVQANNNSGGGKIFYVNNATTGLPEGAIGGSNGNSGLSPLEPLATADYAVGLCSAPRGDKIYLLPGHAETYSSAGALALDVANVEIIGIGVGDNRPTFTFSNTAATIAQSGNGTKLMNVILVPSVDSVVSPLAITGDGCEFDVTVKDASDAVEFVRGVLATGADRLKGKIKYFGRTGGDACVNGIRLINCAGADLSVDMYGKASTAWVEFLTTASTNVTVNGYMYNSGTTNGSKDIIDTVTGSTWYGYVYDGSAGAIYSGGSGSAWASDDASAITANLATLQAEISGGAGLVTFPASAAPGNGVSLAEVIRAIYDNVSGIDGAANVLGVDDADNGFASTNVVGNKDGSVLERLEDITQEISGTTGIATFPASAAPANNVSIAEVLREIYDQADKSITNTAATLVNGTTIFTVAGGSIEILALEAVCVTGNDGTASTLQWSCDGTDGAATTFSGASASLANALAGASVVFQGTTLATAPVVNASGAGIGQQVTNGTRIPAGIITTTVGVGSTTGTWQHRMRYRPLGRGVTVS